MLIFYELTGGCGNGRKVGSKGGGVVEFGRWKVRPAESGVPRRGLQGALKVEKHLHSPFRRVNTVTLPEYQIAQSPIASCAWHIAFPRPPSWQFSALGTFLAFLIGNSTKAR